MFKKMRNRILLLNMAMVTTVVVIAFALIFAVTYIRVQNENQTKLTSYLTPFTTVSGMHVGESTSGTVSATPAEVDTVLAIDAQRISPDAGLSFSMMMDSEGNVIVVNSMVDMPVELYGTAAAGVARTEGTSVVLAGRTWQYAESPTSIFISDGEGGAALAAGEYKTVRFLDVTDSNKMLRSLALTLAGLTVIIMAVFFFISRYFANRAVLPMEEAWEKQSRFIADASHELKTPLTVIGADCGVLYANGGETVESQKKWVDSIMRASDRMTELVTGLLCLARMEDMEQVPQKLPLDMSGLVEEITDEMAPAAVEKGLKMEKDIAPGVMVESDGEHVRRLLSILLDNAVKYSDIGTAVSVSLKKEKRRVLCQVRNTGEGIPEEELPRVFDRFYRADPARSSENGGCGLGLSIARTIADRLDAELTAESRPGEYTSFTLALKTGKGS